MRSFRISLWFQSPRTWVFRKSGRGPVTGHRATRKTTQPQRKINLQIINRIQGQPLTQGPRFILAEALREGKLFGASDGSVKNGMGSHGWIIKSGIEKTIKTTIRGSGPVDGHADFMDSTLSRTSGIYRPLNEHITSSPGAQC